MLSFIALSNKSFISPIHFGQISFFFKSTIELGDQIIRLYLKGGKNTDCDHHEKWQGLEISSLPLLQQFLSTVSNANFCELF